MDADESVSADKKKHDQSSSETEDSMIKVIYLTLVFLNVLSK